MSKGFQGSPGEKDKNLTPALLTPLSVLEELLISFQYKLLTDSDTPAFHVSSDYEEAG